METSQKPPPESPPRGRPRKPGALSAAERMRNMRNRRKAAGLRTVTRWESQERVYSDHRLIEARSLAMHAAIARKIDHDPRLLDIPHRNLQRWAARSVTKPPKWLREWQALLLRPWPEIAATITEPSENGARLRQSTPFAGVLSDAERARIYEAFRA